MREAALIGLMMLVTVCSFALEGFCEFGPVSLDTVSPDLILVAPNGGETWYSGTTQQILWIATDNHFGPTPIDISYSLDGSHFELLYGSLENSGTIPWRLPYIHSDMALLQIRAKDMFGNRTYVQSAAYFTISEPALLAPEGLSISVENGRDVMLSWQPVTQGIDGSTVFPDGYIVLCSAIPADDPLDFEVLEVCHECTYTHENAVLNFTNHFYAVVAYKNYGVGMPSMLLRHALSHSPANSISVIKASTPIDEERVK